MPASWAGRQPSPISVVNNSHLFPMPPPWPASPGTAPRLKMVMFHTPPAYNKQLVCCSNVVIIPEAHCTSLVRVRSDTEQPLHSSATTGLHFLHQPPRCVCNRSTTPRRAQRFASQAICAHTVLLLLSLLLSLLHIFASRLHYCASCTTTYSGGGGGGASYVAGFRFLSALHVFLGLRLVMSLTALNSTRATVVCLVGARHGAAVLYPVYTNMTWVLWCVVGRRVGMPACRVRTTDALVPL